MFPKKTDFWAKAYLQYAPKLLALCRRYVSDAGKAEDLMHDAFVTAISKQHYFLGKGHFEGWLAKITLNTVLMYLRQDKQFNKMLDQIPIEDSMDVKDDSEEDFISTRQFIQSIDFEVDILLEIINLLPEHHRTVFNLYVLEGFSHLQIAATLGISVGTSKSHLARARKKIQTILVQKATQRKQKQRKFMYLPIWGMDEVYLDKLFQKKLLNHRILPNSLPPHLEKRFEKTPTPMPYGVIYGLKSVLCISTFCIGIWGWKRFQTPVSVFQTVAATTPVTPEVGFNSLQNMRQIIDNQKVVSPKRVSKPMIGVSKPIEMSIDSSLPVIIRKQIVLHDTIYQFEEND